MMINSKNLLATLFFVTISFFSLNVSAQENDNPLTIGLKALQIQDDFGLGVDLTSPYFLDKKMAVKLGYQMQWLEHLHGNEITWTSYSTWQLGLKGRRSVLENKLYVTAEIGGLIILPDDKFSSDDSEFGGYGLLGIDWVTTNDLTLFLEFGAGGAVARADRLEANPVYSNGFISQLGFRIHM